MGFLGVYGHVNVDHILLVDRLPTPETTVPIQRDLVRLGGTGGNVARAAAALGVPTAIAACVGDDFPPEFRRTLEASGIDLTDLRHVAGSTPKIWIMSVPDGPQSAIIDQGVMADAFDRPRLDLAWLNSTWVHFTTGSPRDWLAAARDASQAAKRIAFDPAQELSYRYSSKDFEAFLDLSDLFICNEHELAHALRLLGYGDPVQLLDHADAVLVTRGARGIRFLARKERFEHDACPVRASGPVEHTGAGDAFRGGLYGALHRGEGWPQATRAGACAAALFLESAGERFPMWDDVAARRQEWGA